MNKTTVSVGSVLVLSVILIESAVAQDLGSRFRRLQEQLQEVNEQLQNVEGQEAIKVLTEGLDALRQVQGAEELQDSGQARDSAQAPERGDAATAASAVARSAPGTVPGQRGVFPDPLPRIGPEPVQAGPETVSRYVAPVRDSAGELLVWQYGSSNDLSYVKRIFEGRFRRGDFTGDRWGPFDTVYEYAMTSSEVCGNNTPNSTAAVEFEVRTPRLDFLGNPTGFDDVDQYVVDVDLRIRPGFERSFNQEANRIRNLSVLWTQYPIATLMPEIWPCNGAEIRQFNENMARLIEGRESLQAERDARLGMPLRIRDKCDELLSNPTLDTTGFEISSCSCVADIVGVSLEERDVDALEWYLDSAQLALAAFHLNKTDTLSQCITRSARPSSIPVARFTPPPYALGEQCRVAYEAVTDQYLPDPCAATPDAVERAVREYNRVLGDRSICRTGSVLSAVPDVTKDMVRMNLGPQCEARRTGALSDLDAGLVHIMQDLPDSDRPANGCFDFSSEDFRAGIERWRYPQTGPVTLSNFRPLGERSNSGDNVVKGANAQRCAALYVLDGMVQ